MSENDDVPTTPDDDDIPNPAWVRSVDERLTYCGGYRDGFAEGARAMEEQSRRSKKKEVNHRNRFLLEGYFAQIMCVLLKGHPPDDVSLRIYCEEATRIALAMVKKMEDTP